MGEKEKDDLELPDLDLLNLELIALEPIELAGIGALWLCLLSRELSVVKPEFIEDPSMDALALLDQSGADRP